MSEAAFLDKREQRSRSADVSDFIHFMLCLRTTKLWVEHLNGAVCKNFFLYDVRSRDYDMFYPMRKIRLHYNEFVKVQKFL